MIIQHHPTDELLLAYSAGTLDQGQHIAIATHLLQCKACHGWAQSIENLGGSLLSSLPPTEMASDAFRQLEARLDEPTAAPPEARRGNAFCDMPEVPPFVRRIPVGKWRWLAPQVHLQRLELSEPGDTRVFLLRAKPGVKLLPHDHSGTEMTCVLTGSFSHDCVRYGPGDFDWGDKQNSHEIAIGPEGDCICLIAMQGELRLKGFLGQLIQPLISI